MKLLRLFSFLFFVWWSFACSSADDGSISEDEKNAFVGLWAGPGTNQQACGANSKTNTGELSLTIVRGSDSDLIVKPGGACEWKYNVDSSTFSASIVPSQSCAYSSNSVSVTTTSSIGNLALSSDGSMMSYNSTISSAGMVSGESGDCTFVVRATSLSKK